MYIRWLGEYGEFEGMKSFDFEFNRKTECCAEYINEKYNYVHAGLGTANRFSVRTGLLCNPKSVVRTFKTDAWSQLGDNGKLRRGKNGNSHKGYYDTPRNKYHEAWVKPNSFIGIVISMEFCGEYYATNFQQGFENLPRSYRKMIISVSKRYNVPVYILRKNENKIKEVSII